MSETEIVQTGVSGYFRFLTGTFARQIVSDSWIPCCQVHDTAKESPALKETLRISWNHSVMSIHQEPPLSMFEDTWSIKRNLAKQKFMIDSVVCMETATDQVALVHSEWPGAP